VAGGLVLADQKARLWRALVGHLVRLPLRGRRLGAAAATGTDPGGPGVRARSGGGERRTRRIHGRRRTGRGRGGSRDRRRAAWAWKEGEGADAAAVPRERTPARTPRSGRAAGPRTGGRPELLSDSRPATVETGASAGLPGRIGREKPTREPRGASLPGRSGRERRAAWPRAVGGDALPDGVRRHVAPTPARTVSLQGIPYPSPVGVTDLRVHGRKGLTSVEGFAIIACN
jgi:hypothetical protein